MKHAAALGLWHLTWESGDIGKCHVPWIVRVAQGGMHGSPRMRTGEQASELAHVRAMRGRAEQRGVRVPGRRPRVVP